MALNRDRNVVQSEKKNNWTLRAIKVQQWPVRKIQSRSRILICLGIVWMKME